MIDAWKCLAESVIVEEEEELPTNDEKLKIIEWLSNTLDTVRSINDLNENEKKLMCTYLDTNFESILAYEKEVNDGNTFKSLLVDQYFSGMPFEYGHRVYTELNNKSEFNTYLLEYEKYVYSMGTPLKPHRNVSSI